MFSTKPLDLPIHLPLKELLFKFLLKSNTFYIFEIVILRSKQNRQVFLLYAKTNKKQRNGSKNVQINPNNQKKSGFSSK